MAETQETVQNDSPSAEVDDKETVTPGSSDTTEPSEPMTGEIVEEMEATTTATVDTPEKSDDSPTVATLQQQVTEAKEQQLRLAAEFENYKKRMERERQSLIKYAGENILRELLSSLDNLERAIAQGKGDAEDGGKKFSAMMEGVELTQKGLLNVLERFNVKPLTTVGEPFNPNEHEALSMAPDDQVPANHVVQEFSKGYHFKDRLLRAAKVVVSSGPTSTE